MKVPGHLLIEEVKLPPGAEWMDSAAVWRFIRFASGTAYWLGPKLTRPLVEGEVIIVAPPGQGVIRASQLSEVVLRSFTFCPDQLYGLLTLVERHFFETRAAPSGLEVQFLPSTHPVTQRFAELTMRPPSENNMTHRVEVLGLVALHFHDDFARHRMAPVRGISALKRFKQIVEQMPDSEFVNHSPQELARLCGCSPRHFSRLFHKHFGVSVHARQMELRLLKASRLLRETDLKIVQIAHESGWRNLCFFNAMFKNRFGMSPTTWRGE
jgi:AraC-like DNA-binding protein